MKNTANKNDEKKEKPVEAEEASVPNKKTLLEIHGFTLGHVVGTGTYATVKVAWSNVHKTNVAVKIVSKSVAPADYLKKFLPREIEVVRVLNHPNIIKFFQAIESTHRVYIIMEFAENGSLLEVIRRDSYIDDGRARKWFKQLIDAVDYCHKNKVVHRDIKCENMLMDASYNLKLSDFGFARNVLRSASGQYTLSETFCGSYAYACPEILKGIPYQPPLADIWSCGVVLYAMVFGRLPFDDTHFSKLLKQVTNKIVFPREPPVSYQCKSVINKTLAPVKQRISLGVLMQEPWLVAAVQPEEHGAALDSAGPSSAADNGITKKKSETTEKAKSEVLALVAAYEKTETADTQDTGDSKI